MGTSDGRAGAGDLRSGPGAIVGMGRDVVCWGFLLLLAAGPFYWWQVRKTGKEVNAQ